MRPATGLLGYWATGLLGLQQVIQGQEKQLLSLEKLLLGQKEPLIGQERGRGGVQCRPVQDLSLVFVLF